MFLGNTEIDHLPGKTVFKHFIEACAAVCDKMKDIGIILGQFQQFT